MKALADQIFFVSDTHFGHTNIIEYSKRPFADVEKMNAQMIQNWNNVVPPDGIVIHCGDVCMGDRSKLPAIFAQLNGTKHLVYGNHDEQIRKNPEFQALFASVQDLLEITVSDPGKGKQFIVASHYSLRVWNHSHKGAWNVWGHSHGTLVEPQDLVSMDVGVDATAQRYGKATENYRPLSYYEVRAVLSKKTFTPVDHHDGGHY